MLRTFMCIFLLFFSLQSANAQGHKGKKTHIGKGFSIDIPQEFQKVKSSRSDLAFLLRPRKRRYPTLNIIRRAGQYPLERPNSLISNEIQNDYHLTGIHDATIVNAQRKAISEVPAFEAQLIYSLKNSLFRSLVTFVNLSGDYLMITVIDQEESFSKNEEQIRSILNSIKITDKPTPKESTGSFRFLNLLITCLMILCLGFYLQSIWRKYNKS